MAQGEDSIQSPDSSVNRNSSAIIGFLVLALVAYGLFAAGRAIYHRVSPPATLSLAASFEESSKGFSTLRVEGSVQRRGQPLNGQILISFQRLWKDSPQTVSVVATNGKFEFKPTSGEFAAYSKDERLLVSAVAWTQELPNRPAYAEVYLNATGPWRYKREIFGSSVALAVLLAITFFWAFTGRPSPLKNRIAIVFSYCVMVLFLALPFTVTNIFMVMSPEQFEKMEPVGIIVGKPWGAKADEPKQWMLNIGGHFKEVKPKASDATGAVSPSPSPAAGGATSNPSAQSAPSTTGTGSNLSSSGSSGTTPAAGTASSPQNPSSQASQVNAAAPSPPPAEPASSPKSEEREIEGGIAIPFYVLVLAVMGGAINMARKVPTFHQEGERSEWPGFRIQLLGFSIGQANAPAASHPAQTTGANQEQTTASGTSDSAEPWRKGLLDQYMYLLSAPFLAIVTYFLMAWLGSTAVPALVLVSFSVGLITEPVIGRIIETAQKLLGSETQKKAEEDKKKEEAPKKEAAAQGVNKTTGASEPKN